MPNGDDLTKEVNQALEDAERLRMELKDGLRELSAIQATARDDPQHRQFADDLEDARNRAIELLDRIKQLLYRARERPDRPEGFGIAPTAGYGFRLTMLANELQAELEWLKAIIEQLDDLIKQASAAVPQWFVKNMTEPVQVVLTKIRSSLMPLLRKFLAKLWSVISHLLTPKEWKLKGKVGNTVLGLAQAEIEITFGP
jgi:DNA repair exonuclease SbcCD ATPase subunit